MSSPKANAALRLPHVIGVEGGGTKTVAWIASVDPDGALAIRGRGTSGPSNLHAVGLQTTLNNLLDAILKARMEAGLRQQCVDAACLAMAGVDRAREAELFTQWAFTQNIAPRVKVANDSEGLLAAGTKEGWGIALVAGTGSITFGRSPKGAVTRTGGWGYLMGDEGSAYAVALEGLRASVRSADGRDPATGLLPAFLNRLGLKQAEDLLEAVYLSNRDRAWIAALADVVTTTADAGDRAANRILEKASEELARLVKTSAQKIELDSEPVPLCFTGGLILNSPALQNRLVDELSRQGIRLSEYVAVQDPVWGPVRLAKDLLDSENPPD
jgi:N-acetylglucosamine kinase-like BadF-type ATPase